MYGLQFRTVHRYSGGQGVAIPVELRAGSGYVPVVAIVDTGSSCCLFANEMAEALGLDLTSGTLLRFRTANSSFEAYGHEVELKSLGVTVQSTVYFFADPSIGKNVLGQTGWLDRVRLGLVHHDNAMYLAPYDDE